MKQKPDYILLIIVILLIILGIIILANVSAAISVEKFNNTYYFLNHQILFGFLPGIVLSFFFFRIPLEYLKKWVPLLLLINLILLALVFVPKIGINAGGAARWISLGPISLQPSEFLKLTFILYISAWLSSRDSQKGKQMVWSQNQTFITFLVIIGIISLFLIFQPDISTLGIIVLCTICIFFLANTPLWQTFLMISASVVALFALIKISPYRLNRILVFFNHAIDPMGKSYQINQALIATGSGGLSGLGLGMSRFKFGFLPQSIGDSIFAVFAEETGFIGSFILILLFLIFFWRGWKIGKTSQNKFSQLTAWGITLWICLQAYINIGAMIGVLPLTGVPLPFISYGGSALITELAGVGILLNISRKT